MKTVLIVAEKPSIAKSISFYLSDSPNANRLRSHSKYNPVTTFQKQFQNQDATIIVTSVTGHVNTIDFLAQYKKWTDCNPKELQGEAQIVTLVNDDKKHIVKNLNEYGRQATDLFLWLDCDREGEAIAYEVINHASANNRNLNVYRANFSAVTKQDILRAYNNPIYPDPLKNDAVLCRSEHDLRVGAAFTRYQTLQLQRPFNLDKVVSFGPCQFPTLGFIVERHRAIENFQAEKFWYIDLKLQKLDRETQITKTANFKWDCGRIFCEYTAIQLFVTVCAHPKVRIDKIDFKEKRKFKPYPLTTIDMQKIATSRFGWSAHKVMEIAEKLYQEGFISYPRTETNSFPNTMNLPGLIELQRQNPDWGNHAARLIDYANQHYQKPRNGQKDDKAHPPIHPVRAPTRQLTADEKRLYDLVTRRFLACCSKDAIGDETTIHASVQFEGFHCSGLQIRERNFQEVYSNYDRWGESELPMFIEGELLDPHEFMLRDGSTTPPNFLTENELIGLMDKHGIGTDATIAEHIKTVQDRKYAYKEGQYIKPRELGLALVYGYEEMGLNLAQYHLRAAMENDMNKIVEGAMTRQQVLAKHCGLMKDVFEVAMQQQQKMVNSCTRLLNRGPQGGGGGNGDAGGGGGGGGGNGDDGHDGPGGGPGGNTAAVGLNFDNKLSFKPAKKVFPCKICKQSCYIVRKGKESGKIFLGCQGFPSCKGSVFFPRNMEITNIEVSDQKCSHCEDSNLCDIYFGGNLLDDPIVLGNMEAEVYYCQAGCDKFLERLGYDVNPKDNGGGSNQNTMGLSNNAFQPARNADNHNTGGINFNNNPFQPARNANNNNGGERVFTCYKCGENGHIAPSCPNGAADQRSTYGKENQHGKGDKKKATGKHNNYEASSTGDLDDFYGGGGGESTYTCYTCGEEGHFANNCPSKAGGGGGGGQKKNGGKRKKNQVSGAGGGEGGGKVYTCFSCGEEGHFANNCTNKGGGGGGRGGKGGGRSKTTESYRGGGYKKPYKKKKYGGMKAGKKS